MATESVISFPESLSTTSKKLNGQYISVYYFRNMVSWPRTSWPPWERWKPYACWKRWWCL